MKKTKREILIEIVKDDRFEGFPLLQQAVTEALSKLNNENDPAVIS